MDYKIFFELLIVPLIAGLVAEIIKSIIDWSRGEFEWQKLIHSYGGMPSVHAAFTVALTTQVALKTGLDSVPFAIASIFTVLTIRDALGFRNYLGAHGQVLNVLLKAHHLDKKKFSRLEERLGHTVPQVLIGAILGAVIVIIFDLFI